VHARHDIGQVLAPAGLGGRVTYEAVTEPVRVAGLTVEPAAERLHVSTEVASNEWQAARFG